MIAALVLFFAASASDQAFHEGLLALQRGDLPAAQAKLEEASKAAPKDGRVWVALSQTYWREHREADAEEAARKAAELSPEDALVQQSLAIYYSETHQALKAAQAQAVFASKAPENAAARERAGELYFEAVQPLLQAQKFADAGEILKEAVARVPQNAQLELALGVADYGLRRFDEAAAAFLRTIEIAPETEQPYVFLGKVLDQIPGRLPEVTKRFAVYAGAHPSDAQALLRYARALDAQSIEAERAMQLLQRSLALNAADAAAHFEMGALLDRLQRFADAAAEFAKTTELAPSDAAAHYRLARDYDRIGKHDLAQAEREKHARLIQAQEIVR